MELLGWVNAGSLVTQPAAAEEKEEYEVEYEDENEDEDQEEEEEEEYETAANFRLFENFASPATLLGTFISQLKQSGTFYI